jgi:hypothetical protein
MNTQSDMSEELNCSEGARMLIERMQTHPDDFKYNGRFMKIVDQIRGNSPVGYGDISSRDRSALTAAYEKHIMEPSFTEYVVDEIFNGEKRRKEEQEQQQRDVQARYAHAQNQLAPGMLGTWSDPRMALQGSAVNLAQGRQLWVLEQEEKKLQLSIMDKIRRKLKGEPK